jgi:C-terminal processing protease CtpA/Prc
VNWDVFAVRGVRAVETTPNADSLAHALNILFAPVAPSVNFSAGASGTPALVTKPAGATHAIYWRHFGVGSPSGAPASQPRSGFENIYRSERVIAPLAAVGSPIDLRPGDSIMAGVTPRVPDPAHSLRLALDGGVTLSLPIALYTTDSVIPNSLATPRPAQSAERLVAADRATRLASVSLAWSLFQHFYPYFDVVRTDWPAALDVALRSAATDSGAADFQKTLQRLVAALHDGHGYVSRPNVGLGMPDAQLGWVEERVVVLAPGDSGAKAGLHRGDVVLEVDGRPASDVVAETETLISAATPQWMRARALSVLLLGKRDRAARVRVAGPDGTVRELSLTRSATRQLTEFQRDKVGELAPGVMYVDLGRVSDDDFATALPRLEAARGIVFDMRGYPGQVNTARILAHLADSTIHSAHFETPVLTLPDRREVGYIDGRWTIAPIAPRLKARIAFLTGGGAISYAESTLGVVEGYRLGEIVGEPSAGTNGNVNPFVLPGGYGVAWTGMRVVKLDGSPHHGVGILPTRRVSPTIAGVRAGKDEVLDRATDVVGGTPGH